MLGVFFFQLPLGGSTPVQSFMLASKTERFWWISGICRLTSRIVATILLKKD